MSKLKGAQILVECLKREGVDLVFGIPGGANLPTFDALYKSDIKVILTVHEQGAAHMADGYARATGRSISTGPGRPVRAMWKPSRTARAISSARLTR